MVADIISKSDYKALKTQYTTDENRLREAISVLEGKAEQLQWMKQFHQFEGIHALDRRTVVNLIDMSPDIELESFYIDNGNSGMNYNRPAFEQMLADAEQGKINCILTKDLSRLGRNGIDTGYYIEKNFPSIGVRYIAVNDNVDSDRLNDSGAGIMMHLKNLINEAYALDISRKIKTQQNEAMHAGEFIGARPPYGYLKATDNCHKLVIDPLTAPVVRQIFAWAADGISKNDIVRFNNV